MGRVPIAITGTKEPSEWGNSWRKKMEAATEPGRCRMVMMIANDFKQLTGQTRRFNVGRALPSDLPGRE